MAGRLSGLGIEAEGIGIVALIAVMLIPGFIWTSKAKTGLQMAVRAAGVGGAIIGAIALEASLDTSANKLID